MLGPDHLKITKLDTQTDGIVQSQNTGKEIQEPYGNSWSVFGLFGTLSYQKRCYSTVRKALMGRYRTELKREEIMAQYRAPTWLVNRAWRIQAVKASSGWTFKPRTMNIVPSNSKLFEYAETGDVKGLQDLFTKQEASPFDCNDDGSTALHVRKSSREEC